MEPVCGLSLGILSDDLTKEPLPDPMLFIPRVEGQGDLLEQAGFRWDSATVESFINISKSDSFMISYASSIQHQHRYPISTVMEVTFRDHQDP